VATKHLHLVLPKGHASYRGFRKNVKQLIKDENQGPKRYCKLPANMNTNYFQIKFLTDSTF